jgi:hypothetical protein
MSYGQKSYGKKRRSETGHRAEPKCSRRIHQKPPKIVDNIAVRLAWPEPWSKASHQAARRAELAAMTMKPSNFNCAHN